MDQPKGPHQESTSYAADFLQNEMFQLEHYADFPTPRAEAASPPKTTKPGWFARLSLVELVRSILFRRPGPECQNLGRLSCLNSGRGLNSFHPHSNFARRGHRPREQLLHHQREIL